MKFSKPLSIYLQSGLFVLSGSLCSGIVLSGTIFSGIVLPSIVLSGAVFLSSTTVYAQQPLTMSLNAYKVEQKQGKIVYIPVSTASMGTVIQYRATYKNNINRPINNVMVVLPIPGDMTFTGDAYPPSAQASIDGKFYADMPLMRRVSNKLVEVPFKEYKFLRWDIKLLPANKTADVALNTIVN